MSIHSTSTEGSLESIKLKKGLTTVWKRYKFTSNWEYLMISTACTIGVHNFFGLIHIDDMDKSPTIVHYIICYMFVGLPLNYMMVILGQYSQLGILFFKHLCPAGYGLSYAMVLNSLLWCTRFGTIMADFLIYLLACVDTKLEWMSCPPNTEAACWDSTSKCKENCLSESIKSSSNFYWSHTFMHNINVNPTHLTIGKPIWARAVPLCITWAIIYFTVSMGIDRYKKMIRINNYISAISICLIMFVCLLHEGSTTGIEMLFRINFISFTNPSAWSDAMNKVIQILSLSRVFHMTFGSYMTPNMKSDILTIFGILIHFVTNLVMSSFMYATIGIIMNKSHMGQKGIQHVWGKGTMPFFTVLPQGMGFLGVPQLWTSLYFVVCTIILVNSLTIQMDAIQRCITDAHSTIGHYQNYILISLCGFCCGLGVIFSSKEGYVVLNYMYRKVLEQQVAMFDMFLLCVIVFWIYRVRRLSDDIHFMQGQQPTKFWKICWYILPCTTGLVYFYITCLDAKRRPIGVTAWVHYCTYSILICPIPIMLIYQIFCYLKIRNLVGVVQPKERWGPPDPQERHMRRMFNPRQEVRSRRKDDTCRHKCLLGSKHLKRIAIEEKEERKRYTQQGPSLTSEDDIISTSI